MRFKIILILLLFILNNLVCAQENKADSDLGAIANQFQTCTGNISQPAESDTLLIFVSFSMPEQSLTLWSKQAYKLNQPLILRGLINNSMKETTQNKIITGFNIDPEKFKQYHIKSVPAVVLVTGKTYDVIYGDTSLEAALEHILHKGSLSSKPIAQDYLHKIRHKNG